MKLKKFVRNSLITSTFCLMPVALSAGCGKNNSNSNSNSNQELINITSVPSTFTDKDIKKNYEESAKNAKYTILYMQHGGYPAPHEIATSVYLDKQSKGQNKQIMFFANQFLNTPDKWNEIKGYNHAPLDKKYNFVKFENTSSFKESTNGKSNIYVVPSNALESSYFHHKKMSQFIKEHPDEVDLSITLWEFYAFYIQNPTPDKTRMLFDILFNVRKIYLISDGAAQSSTFNKMFDKSKDFLQNLTQKEIRDKYIKYKKATKSPKQLNMAYQEFEKDDKLMWLYLDKNVNDTPFISLLNYDVSYLESPAYKLNNLSIPKAEYQPIFIGEYANWNEEAKPIIESIVTIDENTELFELKSPNFDPNKKNAFFMGDSFFREFPGELGPDKKPHTRLLKMPNVLAEKRKIFKAFLQKYDPKEYNIIFKMHPRFKKDYNIEYIDLISDGALKENDINLLTGSYGWESIMTSELMKFKKDPQKANLLFKKDHNLFEDFQIFGLVPTSTITQTTFMFVYEESGSNNEIAEKVVNPKNFPLPKHYLIDKFMDEDSKPEDNLQEKNKADAIKFFYKYKLMEDCKFVDNLLDPTKLK
ncbi:hypothetical protein [Mycoplasmopsis adleri]|uniref:hypothetical protein n=1 Tax=Mycoplasmopsis adleri TaxID=51362 RepID=UPI0038733949